MSKNPSPIKAIFLDLDDTLVVNEALYDASRAMLYGYLSHFGIKHEESEAALDRIDPEMYKIMGYSRSRLPATYEAVLRHFIPDADAEMVRQVRSFAEKVFTTPGAVKPGVAEALGLLSEKYDLYIVTAGDRSVQQFRLEHLPFKEQIKQAFIVDKKTPEVFADIAAKLGFQLHEVVMVGDSLKSDVIPAVAAGMSGIVIDAKTSSSFHPMHARSDALPEKNAYRYTSLLELAYQLAAHDTPKRVLPTLAQKKTPKP